MAERVWQQLLCVNSQCIIDVYLERLGNRHSPFDGAMPYNACMAHALTYFDIVFIFTVPFVDIGGYYWFGYFHLLVCQCLCNFRAKKMQ